ncbi:alpha/beta hydrolase [Nocardia sp. CA2R105]|uniref:alpha/beta fold hydrolase n=1 Tax=Nocardia coffeae TaxID=2873381 RepID=UPI001CA61E6C|nr:alpha/beta hydrolase [Nocardia coffeae]MBY8858603.1 alpha/beta hydrolase [Nocardia coffeae]
MTITATDGVQLAATRWGPRPAAATIVYVHGLLTDSGVWDRLTRCLHDRVEGGIAQIVYDQRGQGNSGRPPRRSSTTMDRLAEDLDTVLAHAVGAVVLVAHSTGSLLMQAWAQRYPQRAATLSGLVLINGSAEFPDLPGLPAIYRTWPEDLQQWWPGSLDAEITAVSVLLARTLRQTSASPPHLFRCDHTVLVDVLVACRRATLSDEDAAQLRSVPSFVVAGEHDRIVPPGQSIRLADRIWSEYELVSGTGHWLPWTDPDRTADTILQALEIAYRTDRFGTPDLPEAVEDPL